MSKHFDFSNLKGDFFGGITAGIVALPLALAFGVQSGLGPDAGLYGAIIIAFFAALFGGTNTQISGPTAPMTALSMVVISDILAKFDGNEAEAMPIILGVFLLAGVFQVILGLVGIGKYIKYIPYPVVSGFMTAIGIIILITQIPPAIGYYPKQDAEFVQQFDAQAQEVILAKMLQDEANEMPTEVADYSTTASKGEALTAEEINEEAKNQAGKAAGGVIGTIKNLPRIIRQIDLLEMMLALGTIIIIFGFKKITTAIPSTLVALFVMSGCAIAMGWDYQRIEAIPSGLPLPNWAIFTDFSFSSLAPFLLTALSLSLLGAIDSLLTSIVADNMTKTQHKPNKELVGQGIGNTIAAVFGGLPGAGATIRTVVNINAGGVTRLSGMIAGLLLLVILLALGPIASKTPAAVLAGILITVGIGVMDYKGLRALPHMPKAERWVLLIVLILSSIWNLVYAVGIGLVIASLTFMKKMGDLTADRSKVVPLDEQAWSDESSLPSNLKEEVFIKHLDGPLFFGSTSDFSAMSRQIPNTANAVVIRMDRMPYMDESGLYAMEDALIELAKEGMELCMVGLAEQPRYMLERIDIIPDLIPEDHLFSDFQECSNWLTARVPDTHDTASDESK